MPQRLQFCNATGAWLRLPPPGIAAPVGQDVTRALTNACRAVDKDIEHTGAVTEETVDKVRAALALVRATT